ncbi:hypothetical protein AVEN_139800-1 [Araneus ventricosus]|uniref:Uncharacterized protein n=1 Tax=Araneus ventricosus TaxID=182803 RepID=A0A4Y2SR04_ARAVE|nr:hypothetical protein AVEN_139800-1 [Araneus ventricosus]
MRIKMDSEDRNTESNEIMYEAMDTSETLTNENGASNDEPNVAVEMSACQMNIMGMNLSLITVNHHIQLQRRVKQRQILKIKRNACIKTIKHIKKKKKHS